MSASVAALFVRRDSHYKRFADVDCYDERRNALTWAGGVPGVFHPPCRSWARLKGFAKPADGERDLAVWSVRMARRFGGVVEHPLYSDLWRESGCLGPGVRDQFDGVIVTLHQSWFGHRAPKPTALYLVGMPVPDLSEFVEAGEGGHRVELMGQPERERTPLAFAEWLVALARRVEA